MSHDFYYSKEYREKQSAITKENWRKGFFDFLYRREKRKCARKECGKIFEVKQSDPKIYCCRSCSGKVNNVGRIHSEETKLKIAKALTGKKSPYKGVIKVPRVEVRCANPKCKKLFIAIEWGRRERKFCSNKCAIAVIGGKPTSPIEPLEEKQVFEKILAKKFIFTVVGKQILPVCSIIWALSGYINQKHLT